MNCFLIVGGIFTELGTGMIMARQFGHMNFDQRLRLLPTGWISTPEFTIATVAGYIFFLGIQRQTGKTIALINFNDTFLQ